MPPAEHDDRDRDESAPGRHAFRKRAGLREHERPAGQPTGRTAKQKRQKAHAIHPNACRLCRGRRFADGAQPEAGVRAIHPPPHHDDGDVRDVGDDWLIKES